MGSSSSARVLWGQCDLMSDDEILLLGVASGDHLKLGPITGMDAYGYGQMMVAAQSGRFSAALICQTSRHDLFALKDALIAQRASPAMCQSWVSGDVEVGLDFSGDSHGGVRIAAKVAEIGSHERSLAFSLDLDQSYLSNAIEQLTKMIAKAPETASHDP